MMISILLSRIALQNKSLLQFQGLLAIPFRYSVAFFLDPNPEANVTCLPTCVAPGRAPKYPPVTAGEFLHSRLAPTYAHAQQGAS
jgi:hypothetical protein